ncbi:MAG: hypothetical protein EB084_08110 [Proteobacteria bacterium]|nr:hypothetical protein [Pseudomonadota bacterium]
MLQLTSCLSGASPIKPARSHERSESAASLRVAERPDAFVRSPYASPSPSTLPLAHVSPPSASDPAAEASADAASSSAALRVGRCVGAVVSAAVTLSACAAPAAATPPVVGLTELSTPVAAASLTGIEHSAMVDSSASAALAPNAGRSEAATREAQPDVLNLGRPVADQEHDYLTVSGRAQWMKSPPPWGDLGNPTSPVVDVGVSSSGARVRMQTYENGSLLYRVERDPRDNWVGALPPSATDAYIRHGGPAYYGTLNGGPYQPAASLYGTTSKSFLFDNGCGYLHTNGDKNGQFFYVRNLTFYPAYDKIGRQEGQMGLPVSDEYRVKEGLRQDFEGGYLVYNLNTSKVEVYR